MKKVKSLKFGCEKALSFNASPINPMAKIFSASKIKALATTRFSEF